MAIFTSKKTQTNQKTQIQKFFPKPVNEISAGEEWIEAKDLDINTKHIIKFPYYSSEVVLWAPGCDISHIEFDYPPRFDKANVKVVWDEDTVGLSEENEKPELKVFIPKDKKLAQAQKKAYRQLALNKQESILDVDAAGMIIGISLVIAFFGAAITLTVTHAFSY